MPRTCTICPHSQREAIDKALVNGEPLRDIAGRFSISKSALDRHKAEHLPASLMLAKENQETATAALAVWEALYSAPALILLLSPSLRQSGEIFRKTKQVYQSIKGVPVASESALQMELANGSRIVSLPGKEETVRGFSNVRTLIIDEAARVSDDLYHSVTPMLAVSGGRLIALSTPFGRRGWFFESYENGGAEWERIKITADACPRISRDFIEQERRTSGDWWVDQEFFCQFKDTTDQVFAYDLVMGAMSSGVKPLFTI